MRILITGADGFIGQNLRVRLKELGQHEVFTFTRRQSDDELSELLNQADWVFHLAGINRPQDPNEFKTGNADLTDRLCLLIAKSKLVIPIVLSSSIQSNLE
ncbi:MAG: NAD-dependent epimerase/dehydratase family protein, partial [Sphingobacteriaceae bacterium]|nr:NAD-dependent epimerase/dehydratase family protein [Sphingobacteriaceae bacterium]